MPHWCSQFVEASKVIYIIVLSEQAVTICSNLQRFIDKLKAPIYFFFHADHFYNILRNKNSASHIRKWQDIYLCKEDWWYWGLSMHFTHGPFLMDLWSTNWNCSLKSLTFSMADIIRLIFYFSFAIWMCLNTFQQNSALKKRMITPMNVDPPLKFLVNLIKRLKMTIIFWLSISALLTPIVPHWL